MDAIKNKKTNAYWNSQTSEHVFVNKLVHITKEILYNIIIFPIIYHIILKQEY